METIYKAGQENAPDKVLMDMSTYGKDVTAAVQGLTKELNEFLKEKLSPIQLKYPKADFFQIRKDIDTGEWSFRVSISDFDFIEGFFDEFEREKTTDKV